MSKSLEKILIQDLLRAWGWSLAPLEIQVSRLVDLAVVWLSSSAVDALHALMRMGAGVVVVGGVFS